ncbi:MAG: hypothetical protein AB1600_02515 [Bacteroidota bacterium]
MIQKQNWIMGLWKFSEKISIDKLAEVAKKWSEEDFNYLQLYIRKVGKEQRGIGFTYEIPKNHDPNVSYKDYFDRNSEYLKRCFGNDLAGWDIAISAYIIK